jgi:hypothetical protein
MQSGCWGWLGGEGGPTGFRQTLVGERVPRSCGVHQAHVVVSVMHTDWAGALLQPQGVFWVGAEACCWRHWVTG